MTSRQIHQFIKCFKRYGSLQSVGGEIWEEIIVNQRKDANQRKEK